MYVVLEIQSRDDGVHVLEPAVYEEKARAENKYHVILSEASLSGLPCHSAMIITPEGMVVKSEYYVTIPEPEEEEEEPIMNEPEESEEE